MIIEFAEFMKYKLSLDIKFGKHDMYVKLLIPDSYPYTPFRKMLEKNGLEFGEIYMSLTRHRIFLHRFYLFANIQKYQKLLLPEERGSFRGIGKKILCLSLKLFSEHTREIARETKVELEASGGECDNTILDKIKKMSLTEIIDDLKKYPNSFESVLHDLKLHNKSRNYDEIFINKDYEKLNEDDIETLAENVCSIHKNILLVNYYKTFGLNVIDNSDGTAVVMEGLVGDVFDSC